jgi:hypothetical protein
MAKDIIFREIGANVQAGSMGSVIKDKGHLQVAQQGSVGRYHFTDVKAGVLPIVLLGHKEEIYRWLTENQHSGIQNRYPGSTGIYMAVMPYVPGTRYTGLFPIHNAISAITDGITGIAGGGLGEVFGDGFGQMITDVASLDEGRGMLSRKWKEQVKYSPKADVAKKATGELFIRFHCYHFDSSERIGKNYVSFPAIHALLSLSLDNRL